MVSVVIPTYGRPDLLERLLLSVAQQTLPAQEVIVVDDASPQQEAYALLMSSFQSRFAALRYIRIPQNAGAPHARNVGIREACCDWIALVDDDDEWLPGKLEKQWELVLGGGERLGLVHAWADTVNPDGTKGYAYRSNEKGFAIHRILNECFLCSPTVMARKEALLAAGLFDEGMASCQDWDMWTRVFAQGYSCEVVPEVLALYHKHGQGSIGLSKNALAGYKRYYGKHWKLALRHGELRFVARGLRYMCKDIV